MEPYNIGGGGLPERYVMLAGFYIQYLIQPVIQKHPVLNGKSIGI